jgi:hypothetical protein
VDGRALALGFAVAEVVVGVDVGAGFDQRLGHVVIAAGVLPVAVHDHRGERRVRGAPAVQRDAAVDLRAHLSPRVD